MKLSFISNKPLQLSQSKISKSAKGSGYGTNITAGIFGIVSDRSIRTKRSSNFETEIKVKPKISNQQVKKHNDEQLSRVYSYEVILQHAISSINENNKSLKELLEKDRNEVNKLHEKLERVYQLILGERPNFESVAGKKISIKQLAKIYLEYLSDTGVAQPRQNELFKYSNISQPTWSRAFRDQKFWESVNGKIENIFQSNPIVKDKIESTKEKKRKNKEKLFDEKPESKIKETSISQDIPDTSFILQDEMDKIVSPFELKRINKLPKSKLIDEIIKKRPTGRRSELELQPESLLRKVLMLCIA